MSHYIKLRPNVANETLIFFSLVSESKQSYDKTRIFSKALMRHEISMPWFEFRFSNIKCASSRGSVVYVLLFHEFEMTFYLCPIFISSRLVDIPKLSFPKFKTKRVLWKQNGPSYMLLLLLNKGNRRIILYAFIYRKLTSWLKVSCHVSFTYYFM